MAFFVDSKGEMINIDLIVNIVPENKMPVPDAKAAYRLFDSNCEDYIYIVKEEDKENFLGFMKFYNYIV